MTTTSQVVTIRARAFAGRFETIRAKVDRGGTIRVYDSVAGHYTRCHSMGILAESRIRKLAK